MKYLPLIVLLAACQAEPETAAQVIQPDRDACKASQYQAVIGQNIATVTMPKGVDTRVIGPDTMVTMDHAPDRINFYTTDKGVIERVACG